MRTLSELPGAKAATPLLIQLSHPGPTDPSAEFHSKDAEMLRVFERDQEIFCEGDPADSLFRVVRGAVRTYKLLSDGRRQIDAFHLQGDIFGIEPGEDHRFSAEAIGPVTVRVFRRRDLRRLVVHDAAATLVLIEAMGKALEQAQTHMLLLGRKCAREKIASFLLSFAARSKQTIVELPMSRMDIADHLGLTIETVSRTLKQLQRENVIAIPSNRVISLTNLVALRQLESGQPDSAGAQSFALCS